MNQSEKPKDLLLLAGKTISVFMQGLMAIGAAALIIGAGVLLVLPEKIYAEFAMVSGKPDAAFPLLSLLGVMLIGLGIVAALFIFFARLRQIINTVGEGDPFQPSNSDRLSQMAWLILGVQLLTFLATPLAVELVKMADDMGENTDVALDGGFDLSGILMAITLFILARVFRHGAAMRAELEGTV